MRSRRRWRKCQPETMSLSVAEQWIEEADSVLISACEPVLPHTSGLYAFYLNADTPLHPAFREKLSACPHPSRLYIGKASSNLHARIWEQECQHRRPGTFFRSVGVMLGHVSPTGGRNFRFSTNDHQATIAWIRDSLSVAWLTMPPAGIGHIETQLIHRHMPLLNIQHNPAQFPLLSRLRAWSQYPDRRVGTHPLG